MARDRRTPVEAWAAEERRLLDRAPAFRAAVDRIVDRALDDVAAAQARDDGEDKTSSTEAAFTGARARLRRARRRHRRELAPLDLAPWQRLAADVVRPVGASGVTTDARLTARRAVSWWLPTGLGAATLAGLDPYSGHVQARARVLAEERTARRQARRGRGPADPDA
ncbi:MULTISPECIES: hypothetical protein [unclassified Isoptericola]|uniref:hypothetical protein n=1 Tax=unclassified Isoptericola TaxID=2623355 RepID=UPI0036598D09